MTSQGENLTGRDIRPVGIPLQQGVLLGGCAPWKAKQKTEDCKILHSAVKCIDSTNTPSWQLQRCSDGNKVSLSQAPAGLDMRQAD